MLLERCFRHLIFMNQQLCQLSTLLRCLHWLIFPFFRSWCWCYRDGIGWWWTDRFCCWQTSCTWWCERWNYRTNDTTRERSIHSSLSRGIQSYVRMKINSDSGHIYQTTNSHVNIEIAKTAVWNYCCFLIDKKCILFEMKTNEKERYKRNRRSIAMLSQSNKLRNWESRLESMISIYKSSVDSFLLWYNLQIWATAKRLKAHAIWAHLILKSTKIVWTSTNHTINQPHIVFMHSCGDWTPY